MSKTAAAARPRVDLYMNLAALMTARNVGFISFSAAKPIILHKSRESAADMSFVSLPIVCRYSINPRAMPTSMKPLAVPRFA